jgi:hypothetical protein
MPLITNANQSFTITATSEPQSKSIEVVPHLDKTKIMLRQIVGPPAGMTDVVVNLAQIPDLINALVLIQQQRIDIQRSK